MGSNVLSLAKPENAHMRMEACEGEGSAAFSCQRSYCAQAQWMA